MQDPDYLQEDDELEPEEIEAYCVRCKQKVVMEKPNPVWTRRSAPATRGECEMCGTTVFRMGWTEAHRDVARPDIEQFRDAIRPARRHGKTQLAAYINYSLPDAEIAARLAEDLSKAGVPAWFDPGADPDRVSWAGGVHPALDECSHMIVVLSSFALEEDVVREGWEFFRKQRKPVLVVQVSPCEVPDDLRSRPRFDFRGEYKTAFRALVQALAG